MLVDFRGNLVLSLLLTQELNIFKIENISIAHFFQKQKRDCTAQGLEKDERQKR